MLKPDFVEVFLTDVYLSLFRSPWSLETIYEKETKAIAKDTEELRRDEIRIGKALEENAKKMGNFLKAIAAGIDLDGIKSEVDKLKIERTKLETELTKRQKEFKMKTGDRSSVLDSFTEENLNRFLSESGENKRAMLRKVTSRAIVSDEDEKKVIIVETIDGRRHVIDTASEKEFEELSPEGVIQARKGLDRLRKLQRSGKIEWKNKTNTDRES